MPGLLNDRDQVAGDQAAPILTALRSYRGQIVGLEQGRTVGGRELCDSADVVADWLTQLGLSAGDRVVFAVDNGPEFTCALCGTLAAGGSPLVLHGATPPQEIRRYALQYAARFAISTSAMDVPARLPRGRQLPEWLNLHCVEFPLDPQGARFPAFPGATLHPTSGTTGRAKIAVRTATQTFEEARHYVDTMQITARDKILCVVPMSHAYGFGMGFMVSLLSGAGLVALRQFNPRTISRVLAEQQITIFPAVPAMLDLVARAGGGSTAAPRLVLAAGAPLSAGTAAAFRDYSGTAVTSLYGTTETGGITVAVGEKDALPSGCVGRPMPGIEADIAPLAGAELAHGVGRVMIRSSSMMSGYLTEQGIDRGAIRDGWFETGDLGRIDAHGRIHIVGREKEIINVFGMKVIPSEVEEVICALPGVREVKVYPGSHRSGTDTVKVAVAVDGNLDVARIRAHCDEHLPPFKRPHAISIVAALPRTPTGKILRENLP